MAAALLEAESSSSILLVSWFYSEKSNVSSKELKLDFKEFFFSKKMKKWKKLENNKISINKWYTFI
jgi:hypothetical protein